METPPPHLWSRNSSTGRYGPSIDELLRARTRILLAPGVWKLFPETLSELERETVRLLQTSRPSEPER